MKFHVGRVDRAELSKRLRPFAPIETVHSILDIDPQRLVEQGKSLVLLDADNTLLPWRSEDIPETTREWLALARQAGLQLCLVSNTRNKDRLARLSELLEIPVAEGKFKPSTEMYRHALKRFGVEPAQATMIGDQIFTDVWGANRAEIDSILVRPMHSREFVGTRFNRQFEKLIWRKLRAAMEEELDDLPIVQPEGFFHRRIVRQFAKFCIVGLSSFAVDYNVSMTLQFQTTWGNQLLSEAFGHHILNLAPWAFPPHATANDGFFPVAASIGSACAIVNSFIWNRLWTFGIRDKEEAATQFKRFVVVSVIGLILNTVISTVVKGLVPTDPKNAARIGKIVAVPFVAIWNFAGQRLYAFRSTTSSPPGT